MSIFESQTKYGKNEEFNLQLSRGQIPGHTVIFRSAYSNFITNAQQYAVWNRAATYVFPTVASVMKLSSSSTLDVGQLIIVTGLDVNYLEISEVLTLNGQAGVTSTKSFFRINNMQVLTDSPVGSLYFGTGTITAGVPANVYGFIYALDNSMLAANYTVPAGNTLYLYGGSVNVFVSSASPKYVQIAFNAIIGGVDYKTAVITSGGGYQFYPYSPPVAIPEKTDLLDLATTSDASGVSSVTVSLSGILIKA